MILSHSGQVFDEIPLKSWFKRDLKVEFLSEIVMGKIMKSGKVVLLLSGRQVYLVFLVSFCQLVDPWMLFAECVMSH